MTKDEHAVANLEQWQHESGQRLPQPAGIIVGLEGESKVINLMTGEVESPTDNWAVFTEIWKAERKGRWLDMSYCALAVALKKADRQHTISMSGVWADYLERARLLVDTGAERVRMAQVQ